MLEGIENVVGGTAIGAVPDSPGDASLRFDNLPDLSDFLSSFERFILSFFITFLWLISDD